MAQPVDFPFDQIKKCINLEQSFVLQGGAGSGKTETLKRTVEFCTENYPKKRVVCITHTNKAVDEIIARVGAGVEVSTIHSFLSALVKPYKRNLLKLFPELFCLPLFEEMGVDHYNGDDKARKVGEHKRFKALHESLTNRRSLVLQENTEKVVVKREYDKDPQSYNSVLNEEVRTLNEAIRAAVRKHHFNEVIYNDTPFDSFKEVTFGHDGLIKITALLFSQYSNLGKIVRDKYDYIFIDEYQDTDEQIIRSLIYSTPNHGLTMGLFGDSEQAIYEDGIGSAKKIIDDGKLILVEKEDNFRCSPQVIAVANKFRSDGLEQKVALKEVNGVTETTEDREGSAIFYYSIKPPKPEKPLSPKKGDSEEIKDAYLIAKENYDRKIEKYKLELSRRLESLVAYAQEKIGEHVLLKLPNKAVARDANFGNLYELFDNRFRDTRERIKKHLDRLQFGQLTEILQLFRKSSADRRAYNKLICLLKKQGFVISSKANKRELYRLLQELALSKKSAYATMSQAVATGLIALSESHQFYLKHKDSELDRMAKDNALFTFKELQKSGCNTKKQMCDYIRRNSDVDLTLEVIEEKYEQLVRDTQNERFYSGLFGDELSFREVLAFYKYEDDDSNFMTMHKTKGTGIENVVVVLEEFNWYKYSFSSCFKAKDDNPDRQELTRKLLYVACSRAKKNLACVRLLDSPEEGERINDYFDDCVNVYIR